MTDRSWTPSRARTLTRPCLVLTLLSLIFAFSCSDSGDDPGVSEDSEPRLFEDGFDRANGPVGNGWDPLGDNEGGDLEVVGEMLSTSANPQAAGIRRPLPHGDCPTVTVRADLYETRGNDARSRFEHELVVGSDGSSRRSGLGIRVSRTEADTENSAIELIENGEQVDFVWSTFQFNSHLHIEVVFEDAEVVSGFVREGKQVFRFSFRGEPIPLPGRYFAVNLQMNSPLDPPLHPRVDNLSIDCGARNLAPVELWRHNP